jgi:hypothetical protein
MNITSVGERAVSARNPYYRQENIQNPARSEKSHGGKGNCVYTLPYYLREEDRVNVSEIVMNTLEAPIMSD